MGQSHMKNMNKINPGVYEEDNTLLTDYDYSIKAEWIQHQKIMRLLCYTKRLEQKIKGCKPTHPRSSPNSKQDKYKEILTMTHYSQIFKRRNKEQIFKIACEKQLITYK